jgi:hypothetical protein
MRNSRMKRDTQIHVVDETPSRDVTQSLSVSAREWQQPAPESWARQTALEDQISLQAYHRFLTRGRVIGYDVDDWLQAEVDVLQGTASRSSD